MVLPLCLNMHDMMHTYQLVSELGAAIVFKLKNALVGGVNFDNYIVVVQCPYRIFQWVKGSTRIFFSDA